MGEAPEQWQIDMNLCVDLYQDWSARPSTLPSQTPL